LPCSGGGVARVQMTTASPVGSPLGDAVPKTPADAGAAAAATSKTRKGPAMATAPSAAPFNTDRLLAPSIRHTLVEPNRRNKS